MATFSPRAATEPARHHIGRTLAVALLCVTTSVVICALTFELRWESSDDIAMSMVAHGYGIAANSSPNLFFSNVIWGHLVQLLDAPGLIPGYSLASLAVLTLAGATLFTGLVSGAVPRSVAAAAVVLILARPLLFQQFTINAGLVTIAALLCWHHGARRDCSAAAFAGSGLMLLALLIRAPEACLVALVALPLLPWSWLSSNRHARISLLALALGFAGAQVLDQSAYRSASWQDFAALNPLRAAFTDLGAGRAAKSHPHIVKQYGFSANDIMLIGSWFFADPAIADPARLRGLIINLGGASLALHSPSRATRGIKNLWHPNLSPLFAAALLLALSQGGWRTAATWALCLGAVLALGIIGRPGALRVYVPLLSLLIVAPLLWSRLSERRTGITLLVLACAAAANSYRLVDQSVGEQRAASALRRSFDELGERPVVTWGSAFPYESIYTVLDASHTTRAYRMYGLGVFTLAPFSVGIAETRTGNGIIARLASAEGVRMIADQRQIDLLSVYCVEHFGTKLEELPTPPLGKLRVSRQRCRNQSQLPTAEH